MKNTVNNATPKHTCDFGHIGNHASANALNQYDADGNATQIQTSTGTWQITYNGENRPVRFENAGTQTVAECAYDSQGRRFEKKVSVAGTITLRERPPAPPFPQTRSNGRPKSTTPSSTSFTTTTAITRHPSVASSPATQSPNKAV